MAAFAISASAVCCREVMGIIDQSPCCQSPCCQSPCCTRASLLPRRGDAAIEPSLAPSLLNRREPRLGPHPLYTSWATRLASPLALRQRQRPQPPNNWGKRDLG